jgi:hypothetical protein
VLFIFSPAVLGLGAFTACAPVLWAPMMVRRGRRSPELLRGVLARVISLSGFAYLPAYLWRWSRPEPVLCQAPVDPLTVHRLTPPAHPERRSSPGEVTSLPKTQRNAASFKAAGHLSLENWCEPSPNRLAVIDVPNLNAPQHAELQLKGEPLPHDRAIGADRQSLVASRPDYGVHDLDDVDLSGSPELRLTQRVNTVPQPHPIRLVDDDRLVFATMHLEVMVLDYASGEVLSGTPIPSTLLTPG